MIKRNKNLDRYRLGHKIQRSPLKKKKRSFVYKVGHISSNPHLRLKFLFFFVFLFFMAIFSRLFYLQVVQGDFYKEQAFQQQYSKVTLPAKRGEIFASNSKTGEKQKLATNISLDLVYIDPTFIPDKEKVAKALAPILFTQEDYKNCKENIKLCPRGSTVSFDDSITLQEKPLNGSGSKLEVKDKRSMEELVRDYADDILRKISKKYNDYVPLRYGASVEEIEKIKNLQISGLEVLEQNQIIYADPTQLNQANLANYAKKVVEVLPDYSVSDLEKLFRKREIQYVPLKRKISPEVSDEIFELKKKSYEEHLASPFVEEADPGTGRLTKQHSVPHYFKGVVLLQEHWRYYPEKELAAPVIGYVNHEGEGNYGIEEYFGNQISGQDGVIFNRKNVKGEFIFFDKKNVEKVQDGDSFVLTIDKIIQKKTEELLEEGVKSFNADAGQIVVLNPKNGEILAMANYPSFNPNEFGEVYKIQEIKEWVAPIGSPSDLKPKTPQEGEKLYYTKPVFVKNENGEFERFYFDQAEEENEKYYQAIIEGKDFERKTKYIYENRFGLRNYINHNTMSIYEPGSIFKPIVVAMALDANEVEPGTTYEEFGPIEIDTGTSEKQYIRTAENIYRGIQTVTNAVEHSSNIGMAFVARKLGRQLFYNYLKKFNFGEKYNIENNGEQKGGLVFWKNWTEAKLLTSSFGQGISVTPLQVAVAWGALANGGKLIQPSLVKEVIHPDGTSEKKQNEVIRQVISEETSAKITSILVSSVENGAAKPGGVEGYKVAGKTGTAQISCSDSHRCTIGRYEFKKEGNFITGYTGYAPVEDPRFVIVIKLDRPRVGVRTYGSNTAALIHAKLTKFLLDYYGIEPEKKD